MSVSTLVLLGLAVVWAIVLLPEGLKRLSSVRNGDSIRSFNHQLSSLGRRGSSGPTRSGSNVIDLRSRSAGPVAGRPAAARPAVPAHVRKRRQEVLTVLGAAAVLTLLCAVAFGGFFLLLHLVADALLITYVVLLNQAANQAPARRPVTARPTPDRGSVGPARPVTGMVHDDYGPSIGRVSPVSARRIAN
jgi:hypothetical protein